jgi:hypothetical protein
MGEPRLSVGLTATVLLRPRGLWLRAWDFWPTIRRTHMNAGLEMDDGSEAPMEKKERKSEVSLHL